MIKNLLLSIAVVFAGLIVFAIVVNLVSWLVAYIDYKKQVYKIRLDEMRNPEDPMSIAECLFGRKSKIKDHEED